MSKSTGIKNNERRIPKPNFITQKIYTGTRLMIHQKLIYYTQLTEIISYQRDNLTRTKQI
ncbi:hypothetical protein Hanom_Chr15g01381541 [Helianthus anomalus]